MAAKRIFWDAYGLHHRNSGVFVHASHLAHDLKPLGVVPTIVGYQGFAQNFAGWPTHEFPNPGVGARLFTNKVMAPKAVARYVAKVAAQSKLPVVLHGLSNINLGAAAKLPHVHGVVTVHDLIPQIAATGEVSNASRLQFKLLFGDAVRRAERVICVSEWTRRTLLEHYPSIDAAKVVMIPNGFPDTDSFRADEHGELKQAVHAIAVARGETYKRLDWMCDIVRKARGNIVLSLVTDDKGAALVKARAKDLMLAQAIKLWTAQTGEQVRQLYKKADVLLHTSKYEGFCLPAAEALSAGLPVVFQKGSGIDEVVGAQVGTGLEATATIDDWVDATSAYAGKKYDLSFQTALREHLQRMKRWKDVANELKSLYETL